MDNNYTNMTSINKQNEFEENMAKLEENFNHEPETLGKKDEPFLNAYRNRMLSYKTWAENFSYDGKQNRNWFQRTFLNYKDGSMRSTIITLFISSTGIGCYALPVSYANIGMIPASVILTYSALSMIIIYYM